MSEQRPLSILVVEDDAIHRDLVSECLALAEPNMTPEFAATCGEALVRLSKQVYDCVVLDHNLPDGTGAELLEQARFHLLTTPVVAFSTSVDPSVILEEFKGGCVDFLPKREAFCGDSLASMITMAVERFRMRSVVERCGATANLVTQAARLIDFDNQAPRSMETSVQEQVQLIYETAVRTIQDGLLLVERRTRVLYANPGFKRLIGLAEAHDLPGHPLTTIDDLFTPEAAHAFHTASNGGGRYESVLLSADGVGIPVQIGESALGKHGLICAVTDLRAIKAQQRELERKNRRLAELNEMANRFVDNVSHEFRTPLTVIKGYTEVMTAGLAGEVNGQQRAFLDTILDRTRDLAQMVDDLLDTSKLRAGSLRVDRRPTSLTDVLARIQPGIDQKAHTNRTTVIADIEPYLPPVYVDAEKVGRVILNLVVNAIKFSDEASQVVIRASHSSEDEVTVSVTDHGPGISPENLKIIFDRFRQVGNPQRSSTKGFGLGLNIANELVAMNLGTMQVTSEIGKGSTFSFTIPAHHPQHVAARLIDRTKPNPEIAPYIALLRAHMPDHANGGDDMHEFLTAHTYPMDLVFVPAESDSIILFGLTADPDAWAKRLAQVRNEQVMQSRDPDHYAIEFNVEGHWQHGEGNREAIAALGHALEGKQRHDESDSDH